VCTAFDGYPMTQKGLAAKALGAAIECSAIGGFLSAVVMAVACAPLASIALSFDSPEYFALVFMGLCVVTSISGKSLVNGVISLFIGLFLASVGVSPIQGVPRYDLEFPQLRAGIDFIIVMIGVFALGEVFSRFETLFREESKKIEGKVGTDLLTLKEFLALKWTILRSFVIGTFIGFLPGAGATIASFVSYGIARNLSDEPSKFGTGVIEGVAAPETANNAATGGAMIPLLALGIPGGGATAVMISAFMIKGLQPGPLVFMSEPGLIGSIFVGMIIANLLILIFGFIAVRAFTQFLKVPYAILSSGITLFCFLGAFARRNVMYDVWVMLIFGIIGYFMKKHEYPVGPLVLGMILGPLAEDKFLSSLISYQNDFTIFFTRPISGSMIAVSFCFLIYPLVMMVWKKRRSSNNR
jgi:putative tricarboxylic transport membrane protein